MYNRVGHSMRLHTSIILVTYFHRSPWQPLATETRHQRRGRDGCCPQGSPSWESPSLLCQQWVGAFSLIFRKHENESFLRNAPSLYETDKRSHSVTHQFVFFLAFLSYKLWVWEPWNLTACAAKWDDKCDRNYHLNINLVKCWLRSQVKWKVEKFFKNNRNSFPQPFCLVVWWK